MFRQMRRIKQELPLEEAKKLLKKIKEESSPLMARTATLIPSQ